ncbi:MAG: radical SAM family heme chaperone HemW [Psychromonas sp.]|nr:radical SAM family heme chaperone HemW [Psychromonas sp.]
MQLPPLSLYIHIPWCIEKCPYCDFNSHKLQGDIPEREYLQALIEDLKQDLVYVQGRELCSIFIGGGTPSLISADGIERLLKNIAVLIPFRNSIEITLEANPGTIENKKICDFKAAGVNRFSFGVQSFQQDKLTHLGRIHDPQEAKNAAINALNVKINSFNLDLMHGLPSQTLSDAISDLQTAIDLKPMHISWYQLTVEQNTPYFYSQPILPNDDLLWDIEEAGQKLLAENGYRQYEISGYSQQGFECEHNLNYWTFGDYIGIGCGAHGKFTLPLEHKIIRTTKIKHPKGYLDKQRSFLNNRISVVRGEIAFEYMINRLRLFQPITFDEFKSYTGLILKDIDQPITRAIDKKLLVKYSDHWEVTTLGHRYLNDLINLFCNHSA